MFKTSLLQVPTIFLVFFQKNCILRIGYLIFLLSGLVFYFNASYFHFHGNNYFPTELIPLILIWGLCFLGTYFLFGQETLSYCILKEILLFFLVVALIAFASNAVQYTPFSPIDKTLLNLDLFFHVPLAKWMNWLDNYPVLKKILEWSYDSLSFQMSYLPFFMIFLRKFNVLREFYTLMLITTLLGFSFYYFFPSVAPATLIESPHFMPQQYATHIKFYELHQLQIPSTKEGGLISFPSFHAIWAWLCFYMMRDHPLKYLLFPLNILLFSACILLGWHYMVDLVGSALVILLSHLLYKHCR